MKRSEVEFLLAMIEPDPPPPQRRGSVVGYLLVAVMMTAITIMVGRAMGLL